MPGVQPRPLVLWTVRWAERGPTSGLSEYPHCAAWVGA